MPQPSIPYFRAWNRHRICWLAYPHDYVIFVVRSTTINKSCMTCRWSRTSQISAEPLVCISECRSCQSSSSLNFFLISLSSQSSDVAYQWRQSAKWPASRRTEEGLLEVTVINECHGKHHHPTFIQTLAEEDSCKWGWSTDAVGSTTTLPLPKPFQPWRTATVLPSRYKNVACFSKPSSRRSTQHVKSRVVVFFMHWL